MKNITIIYFLMINFLGFILMYIDKKRARRKEWRIPENTLMLSALLGGSIGSLIGMNLFRHKTKHIKFKIGIPLILILQIALYFYIFIPHFGL